MSEGEFKAGERAILRIRAASLWSHYDGTHCTVISGPAYGYVKRRGPQKFNLIYGYRVRTFDGRTARVYPYMLERTDEFVITAWENIPSERIRQPRLVPSSALEQIDQTSSEI